MAQEVEHWNLEREQDYLLAEVNAIRDIGVSNTPDGAQPTIYRFPTVRGFLTAYRESLKWRVMAFNGNGEMTARERAGILKFVEFLELDDIEQSGVTAKV